MASERVGQMFLDWWEQHPDPKPWAALIDEVRRIRTIWDGPERGWQELAKKLRQSGFEISDPPKDYNWPDGTGLDRWTMVSYLARLNQILRQNPLSNGRLRVIYAGVNWGNPESLVGYLESDSMLHGSGYIKLPIIKQLAKLRVNEDQRVRILLLLERALLAGWQMSLPGWERLSIWASDQELLPILIAGLSSDNPDVVEKTGNLIRWLDRRDSLKLRVGKEEWRWLRWRADAAEALAKVRTILPAEFRLPPRPAPMPLVGPDSALTRERREREEKLRAKHAARRVARHRFASDEADL